ncbi:unnamed protein product [Caenorhabditis angaria]|uniref:ZP domain-containing protein n=1 Tax=Caenorhabditis angaria TaxID=860376 RepID=A0A9P1N371_9PELO|nr:unnamed protein product [Caenorhabditis angaria]
MKFFFSKIIFLLLFLKAHGQYVQPQYAEIRAVSAMCSSDGITASIDFDKPFTGKIYSLNYATVGDCLYYNNIDRDTVLFSIPAHICGTKLQRTTRNNIDQMENRVYVQMDKDTQTSADKQFSFVCKLTDSQGLQNVTSAAAKDDSNTVKDSYSDVPPIRPVASSVSTKMHSPMMSPIKPTEVRQISAFSKDAHIFGNWPIPGSKPYEASMQPVSTYPLAPISPEVHQSTSTIHPPIMAHDSHPQVAGAQGEYVTRPISTPFMRSPILARTFTTAPPVTAFTLFPPGFTLLPTIPPPTTSPSPIIPNIHFKQGVGVPFVPGPAQKTEKIVDADHWNDPNAYATPPQPNIGGNSNQNPTTKFYKEEPPTASAPFSSDSKINVDTPKPSDQHHISPITTSVLKTHQDSFVEPEVTLEIQRGEGPFAPPVTTPIKIGDNISLVIKAKSYLNDSDDFDMFAHSCFATDGKGDTKVQMIDENGCVIRREFASELRRVKDPDNMMFYYMMIKAFKFPGPDDVYFSCTIEFTPMTKAPRICSKLRRRRQLFNGTSSELRLFDSVNVKLLDDNDNTEIQDPENLKISDGSSNCELKEEIYLTIIVILMISTTISLISNIFQFSRNIKTSRVNSNNY